MPEMQSAREAIAAEVRAEMARQRVSQVRVAALLGTSQPSVSRKLRGVQSFTGEELLLLATAFDVEVARFLPVRAYAGRVGQNSVGIGGNRVRGPHLSLVA